MITSCFFFVCSLFSFCLKKELDARLAATLQRAEQKLRAATPQRAEQVSHNLLFRSESIRVIITEGINQL